MSRFRIGGAVAVALLAVWTGTPAPAAKSSTEDTVHEILSHDGLEKLKAKGADLVYARPGATLAGYSKVIIGPVNVAFSKSWDPKRPGSNFKISSDEREEIRNGVAKIVRDEFIKTLEAKDGYPIVEAAAPDALLLKVGIINLYVNAPDVATAGRTRTYVQSAGEMTLVLEAFDSESGQVLARVVDRQESDMRGGQMTWTNRTLNAGEAQTIASDWARKLRKLFDKAHGIGKK
jgi:hypothetical protein